jgi:CubicO group peptidase (beta-lactamase class C family)
MAAEFTHEHPMIRAAVLSLVVAATPLAAQQYRIPADSVVQRILDEQVGPKHTVGVIVGLLDADGTRRILTAGKADHGSLPLDGNTLFEIGSITKTFTGALLADAVRRGEVKLDDPVQKFLPASVTIPSKDGKIITLYDLATVSSGLPGMPNNFAPKDRTNPYADYTVEQMYQFLNGYTLTRLPGEKYEYSNLGMGLLGHALALRARKSYYDLLAERILKPLGMNDTWILLTPALEARMATGHAQKGNPVSVWDIPTLAGAGALRSSVNDMFKYLAANLDSTSKPLGPTLAMTHARQRPGPAPTMPVGLAWHHLVTPAKNTIVWHNGGTGGVRPITRVDPGRNVGVILHTK